MNKTPLVDNAVYEQMAKNIPSSRVNISRSRWMSTWGFSAWITLWIGGAAWFYFVGSERIFAPYSLHKKQTLYKAFPDYASGNVVFYEKEVRNVIRDL